MIGNLHEARSFLSQIDVGYREEVVTPSEELTVRQFCMVPDGVKGISAIIVPEKSHTPTVLIFDERGIYAGCFYTKEKKFLPAIQRLYFDDLAWRYTGNVL